MEKILHLFLGFLAQYVIAFLKNFKAARADNPKLWETAETIILQISTAHPDWSGEQKRSYAFDAIKLAAKELLHDVEASAVQSLAPAAAPAAPGVSDSAINTMIELIVQKMKA
jgi:hypothetical protein